MSYVQPADLTFFVVEPSTMQGKVVEQMLNRLGVSKVQHLTTGAEVLAQVASVPMAVVVSSYYLSDMAGADLVVALRQRQQTEGIPFILISSETRPQMLEPVRQSGACFILRKPFSDAQLSNALQSVLDYMNPDNFYDIPDVESLRVLLVDDSVAARRHIRRLLEDIGVSHIIEAENGVAAVAALAGSMVDLVLTDYNMPEMDGQALTEYIRTQSWQNDVPILMLTSESDQGRLAAVEKAGVSAVCDKPFDARTIQRIIAEALKAR